MQRELHTMLLGECWIVNKSFVKWYTDPQLVEQSVISAMAARHLRHNELLKRACPNAQDPEEAPFLFVVESADEVEPKIRAMFELATQFLAGRHPSKRIAANVIGKNGA